MRILIPILVLVTTLVSESLMSQNNQIEVTVENIFSSKGTVRFALYNEKDFRIKPLKTAISKINNSKATIVFEDVKKGTYAIICFHDKNENEKMDFTPNGMPLESYGTSGVTNAFGPPTFEETKFLHDVKPTKIKIKL
ncbi:DUF2141 domain-containing protein [Polaribacter tangerinus]|uniref:DUF2141 domain-containing protein n=1 Tax=Polaribacter tangerinus TaxID=1920034 RepID=UPI000B4AB5BA|nr:DUF2141 domain-containing protein [Polaribacter tangerinus]